MSLSHESQFELQNKINGGNMEKIEMSQKELDRMLNEMYMRGIRDGKIEINKNIFELMNIYVVNGQLFLKDGEGI